MATFDRTGISMPRKIGPPKNETKKKDQRNKYETQKIKSINGNIESIKPKDPMKIQKSIENNEFGFYMVTA